MPSAYVKPVNGKIVRTDQGVDIQGKPGAHVVALGLARVDAVKDDPGGFGKAIYYTLLSGPQRGQQIYVGHAQPTVTAGALVQPGQPVATLLEHGLGNASGLSGWTEIGFAKDGVPDAKQPGKRFLSFYNSLGAAPPAQKPDAIPQPGTATVLPDTTQDTTATLSSAPPDPYQTQPQALPPGTGGVENLWRLVASQPNVSPDTLQYAQNVTTAAGG